MHAKLAGLTLMMCEIWNLSVGNRSAPGRIATAAALSSGPSMFSMAATGRPQEAGCNLPVLILRRTGVRLGTRCERPSHWGARPSRKSPIAEKPRVFRASADAVPTIANHARLPGIGAMLAADSGAHPSPSSDATLSYLNDHVQRTCLGESASGGCWARLGSSIRRPSATDGP